MRRDDEPPDWALPAWDATDTTPGPAPRPERPLDPSRRGSFPAARSG